MFTGASEPQRPVRPWPYHFFIKKIIIQKTAAGCYSCCEVRLRSAEELGRVVAAQLRHVKAGPTKNLDECRAPRTLTDDIIQ